MLLDGCSLRPMKMATAANCAVPVRNEAWAAIGERHINPTKGPWIGPVAGRDLQNEQLRRVRVMGMDWEGSDAALASEIEFHGRPRPWSRN